MKPLPQRFRQPNYIIALVLLTAAVIAIASMVPSLLHTWHQVQVEMATTPTPVPPPRANMLVVTPDPNAPTPAPVLKNGSVGEAVRNVQQRLQALGYYQGELDGQYGPGTSSAVQLFQSQHGLQPDGAVGPDTSAILFSSQAKLAQPTQIPEPSAAPAP